MKTRVIAFCIFLAGSVGGADRYTILCQEAAESSKRQDYQQAIRDYQEALTLLPGAPEASNNLAVMYYQVGRFPEALQLTSPLWRSHPELKSAALLAGMAAVQCNKPSEALEPLTSLLRTDPNNRDALLALASAYIALKQLPKAVPVYEHLLQVMPEDPQAWYGAAICYETLAEESSRKLAHMPGGVTYSKRLLAEYLQNVGDAKLAAEAYGESSSSGSGTAEAVEQYQKARALAEKSRNAFEQFVRLSPDSWQTALFLGDVERQRGNLNEAIGHYSAAEQKQPDNPAPALGLGTAYWELGNFDQANTYLKKALQLRPGSPQAIFELGNIAVRQHRESEAIPLLQQYLASQPDALAARADLGRAYFHLKDFSRAAIELEKAAAIDTTGDIHYQLAQCLRNLGRATEADAALRKSSAIRQEQLQRSQRLHK
jgi:tetratricopeptide (TPR) repeat protein